MLRRHVPVLLGVLLPTLVFAQAPGSPEVPAPAAPPMVPMEDPPPSAPPAADFLAKFVQVDARGNATMGRDKRPITHRQLFELAGRTDLVEQSDRRASRRLWLAVGAGAVTAVGVATGVALLLTAPKLASPACENDVRIYNEVCIPRVAAHQTGATIALAGGVAIGALLATLAYWSNPDVTTRDETVKIASEYNAKLKRGEAPTSLRLAPFIAPGLGGLVAQLRF